MMVQTGEELLSYKRFGLLIRSVANVNEGGTIAVGGVTCLLIKVAEFNANEIRTINAAISALVCQFFQQ